MTLVSEAIGSDPDFFKNNGWKTASTNKLPDGGNVNYVHTETDHNGKPITYWGGLANTTMNYTGFTAPTLIEKLEILRSLLDTVARVTEFGFPLTNLLDKIESKLSTLLEEL